MYVHVCVCVCVCVCACVCTGVYASLCRHAFFWTVRVLSQVDSKRCDAGVMWDPVFALDSRMRQHTDGRSR
jgi:hypothetical protein